LSNHKGTQQEIGVRKGNYMNNNETPDKTGENRDNMGRFRPGMSGNPTGRPAGVISITAEIKKKLLEVPDGQQKSYLELLVHRIIKQAVVDGNEQMIKQIWFSIDGTPRQQAENPEPVAPVMQVNLLNKEESGVKVLA